jgi:uroporphyrinogen-III decarboxylase
MLRNYLPRVSGATGALSQLPSFSSLSYGYFSAISLAEALARPEIASSLERLQKAGRLLQEWRPRMEAFRREIEELGFPDYTPYRTLAPFDAISDHLRGMRGSMLDLYRQPDKLLEACDAILRNTVARIKPAEPGKNNRVGIPLHRGSEGFMSIKQFEKFYWPTLKGLIVALVEKGYTPCVAFEGDYTSRLEYLRELPKGKVLGHFDTTDLFQAKKILRGHMCISGNIPCSILQTGTPDDVREQCRKLIDFCGKDGGYIMSTRSPVDDARPENLKALIEFTREYGIYR